MNWTQKFKTRLGCSENYILESHISGLISHRGWYKDPAGFEASEWQNEPLCNGCRMETGMPEKIQPLGYSVPGQAGVQQPAQHRGHLVEALRKVLCAQ